MCTAATGVLPVGHLTCRGLYKNKRLSNTINTTHTRGRASSVRLSRGHPTAGSTYVSGCPDCPAVTLPLVLVCPGCLAVTLPLSPRKVPVVQRSPYRWRPGDSEYRIPWIEVWPSQFCSQLCSAALVVVRRSVSLAASCRNGEVLLR